MSRLKTHYQFSPSRHLFLMIVGFYAASCLLLFYCRFSIALMIISIACADAVRLCRRYAWLNGNNAIVRMVHLEAQQQWQCQQANGVLITVAIQQILVIFPGVLKIDAYACDSHRYCPLYICQDMIPKVDFHQFQLQCFSSCKASIN